jgi:Nitrile hydratase beta subunit, C-terminal
VSLVPGQAVTVSSRAHAGHHRTPSYLKGRRGTVVRPHGTFPNPETRAYGANGSPALGLYLVRFEQDELWPGYQGSADDCLLVDLFEHWLEEDA